MSNFLNLLVYFFLSLIGLSDNVYENLQRSGYTNGGKSLMPADVLINQDQVDVFYKINDGKLFWFQADSNSFVKRIRLKAMLDSAMYEGLNKADYHYETIISHCGDLYLPEDSLRAMSFDRIYTDAALTYGKDLWAGGGISDLINSDEISPSVKKADERTVIRAMRDIGESYHMQHFIPTELSGDSIYSNLKSALKTALDSADVKRTSFLAMSINQYRWIRHFRLDRYIVVNIPAASLSYFEAGRLKIRMKTVVGKPSTRTPRLATYCDKLVIYPYWYVPRNIAINEFLPIFKTLPSMVDDGKFQVLDSQGRILDADKIDWSLYSRKNFPFQLRQSTGCDNALGILKFNLTSPFDVYLHDTNLKTAFKSSYRFYSHGCIRLEKPFQLANAILKEPLDSSLLSSAPTQQAPKTVTLQDPVPVFVVYMPVESEEYSLRFYTDIYGLLN